MTALKLGAYNGLHVALSAQTSGIPVIVLGPNDAGLENEARAMGVRYLSSAAEHDQLACVVEGRAALVVLSAAGRREVCLARGTIAFKCRRKGLTLL